jgi:hypothetical protein
MPDTQRLLNAIDAAEEDAYGSDSDSVLATERAYSINLYLGKNVDPVQDGRSTAIDRTVMETIESIKPSLVRIFANGGNVVELPALGPDDEAGSKQEAAYLNHVVTQKNNWFEIFLNWVGDALLTKNAYAMAYKDTFSESSVERYERQTEAGLALLLQDKDVEVTAQKSYPDPDYVAPPPQIAQDPTTGQSVMMSAPPAPMLYDIELRRKAEKGRICIKVLAPERCKISERTPSWRLVDCDYFEYWENKTISDLRSEGFDVEDDIPSDEDDDPVEDQARDQYNESTANKDQQLDPAMRRVKVRVVWIRHDYDEDGIAELLYVVRVGKTILYQEEVSRIPVASIVPVPLGHRHVGLSMADLCHDIQRIKTAILRQGLDNLYLTNNQRTAITDKVNLDDMLMNRPGGLVRVESGGIPANEIMPLVTPFMFPQAMEGLNHMDRVRQQRTGVSEYFTGIDENSINDTAAGIRQLSSMAEQRVELIARIIATGVEDLFSIVHELILKSGHQKETVRLLGKWTEVDPATWKKRTDFRIAVAYAAGNKDSQVQKLMMVMNLQKEAMMGGLPIVQPNNVYEAGMELIKATDLTSPERFLTNPANVPPPQPPQPDPTVMAAEQMKSQTTLQVKDAELRTQKEVTAATLQADREKAELEAQTKLTIEQMKSQTSLQSQDKDAEHKTKLHKLEHGDPEIDKKVGEVGEGVQALQQQLTETISQLQDALRTIVTAQRRIRRGADGKAEGVDIVGPDGAVLHSQTLQRGPDGRVAGAA